MTATGSFRTLLMLVVAVLFIGPATAAEPSPLTAGSTFTYRYAIYGQDLVDAAAVTTRFGFMTCDMIAMHGVEPGAFRVECEGGAKDASITWNPWSQKGYYVRRADGLHHVASPGASELLLPAKPDDVQWTPRAILVLGEPVDAMCSKSTEPAVGQSVFEEACWTLNHGSVFFVGVDTSSGIAEASWELIEVKRPGEAREAKVSIEQAKKLVKGWVWAQNANRLQNYSWLYGAVFHGVERGAAGTGSFDRSSWLKRRQKLFMRRTRIRVEDIKVQIIGDMAVVLFEQHRDLGGSIDHGLRELRLAVERGRVVIAREEMLYAMAK